MPVPVAPPVATWSGLYVGVNGGYFEGVNNTVSVVGLPNPCNSPSAGCQINPDGTTGPGFGTGGSSNPYQGPTYSNTSGLAATFDTPARQKGVLYGGQIGLNSQIVPKIVVGLEADLQGISNNNDAVTVRSATPNANFPGFPVTQTATLSSKLPGLSRHDSRARRISDYAEFPVLHHRRSRLRQDGVQHQHHAKRQQSAFDRALRRRGHGLVAALRRDHRRRPRMAGHPELERQGRISLRRPRHVHSVNFTLINPLASLNFSSATVVSSTRFSENLVRAGLNYHF